MVSSCMDEKGNLQSAVKIAVNGVEWYYQTVYDVENGIDRVNLYDSSRNFVRSFYDFNDMIECVQSCVVGKDC